MFKKMMVEIADSGITLGNLPENPPAMLLKKRSLMIETPLEHRSGCGILTPDRLPGVIS